MHDKNYSCIKMKLKIEKQQNLINELLPTANETYSFKYFVVLLLIVGFISLGELPLHYLMLAIVVLNISMPTILTNNIQHQQICQTYQRQGCLLLAKIKLVLYQGQFFINYLWIIPIQGTQHHQI